MTLPNFLLKSVFSKSANMNKQHPTASFWGVGECWWWRRSSSLTGLGEAELLALPALLWPLLGLGGCWFNSPMWSCRKPPPVGFSLVSQEQWAVPRSHNSSPHFTLSAGSSGDTRYRNVLCFSPSLPFINLSLAEETRQTVPGCVSCSSALQ